MSKTNYMMIEQTALKPWREDVDIVDAALVNHVHVRLSRRAKQRIVVHEGVQCVWIHYPTVRGENWLLQLKDRTLSARFTKLVNLGLLIRRQISLKSGKGSRTYYGISDVLKKQYEELDDRVDRDHADLINIEGTHPQQNAGHSYEAQNGPGGSFYYQAGEYENE